MNGILKEYLNQRDVYDEICRSHSSDSGLMEDFCDGTFVKENEFIRRHQKCLQIVFNTNSLQICNPLYGHTSHKLDVFYFSVVNVPP